MFYFIKIHWPFWLRLLNLIKYIGQISHSNQIDWSKNTFFEPLVKMDMSISKKWLISQFELFEKPKILVMSLHVVWMMNGNA
jgi:hypothetical protein